MTAIKTATGMAWTRKPLTEARLKRVYEARWNKVQATWSARNGFLLHSDATHWQALPAAPTPADGGGE